MPTNGCFIKYVESQHNRGACVSMNMGPYDSQHRSKIRVMTISIKAGFDFGDSIKVSDVVRDIISLNEAHHLLCDHYLDFYCLAYPRGISLDLATWLRRVEDRGAL